MTTVPTVLVTGLAVRSAAGPGLARLYAATAAGRPLFRPVDRFAGAPAPAATLDGSPALGPLLAEVVAEARAQAGCPAGAPLLLAAHADERTAAVVEAVDPAARVYTGACVAASTAVADAAAAIRSGRQDRVVVAAGYLVERDTYALFAAGRALSRDGSVRPFSRDRGGILLGDAVVAVVLESAASAGPRAARALARLAGWGRAGDAHHVCRPAPDGGGLARAARSALARASLSPADLDYVNANGVGSALGDRSESAALRLLFGAAGPRPPIGATKSVHGHALEASALLELAVTVACLPGSCDLPGFDGPPPAAPAAGSVPRPGADGADGDARAGAPGPGAPVGPRAGAAGGHRSPAPPPTGTSRQAPGHRDPADPVSVPPHPAGPDRAHHAPVGPPLPATAGWLGADPECGVRPHLPADPPPDRPPAHALTLNAAFGGANTALVLAAA
ncbi:beta-ketoacyl synthase N-terminal-like domain-containing protein [Actinacidiphila sp. ITFR-21]|uniref:beta-ketoacyl synthase N-terminal-like domain-containing protein n=1 Tax=Actinacidiphila sp. ITFR-21 TaxID=3075199 RepID=UPI00288B7C95|nr:beta-ketoacyl synthase N-terminal-like domain-containing protein [Streptomyces sp. ITFR-21]WNI19412.1 beta-ketoacyl synthase N-terminal-like domain-containing protein [Streptomyces sp. ITFR-21]